MIRRIVELILKYVDAKIAEENAKLHSDGGLSESIRADDIKEEIDRQLHLFES